MCHLNPAREASVAYISPYIKSMSAFPASTTIMTDGLSSTMNG
jgi:hypothetical protein